MFEQYFAPLRPGDTAFHAMLYPGVYPAPLDRQLHAEARAGHEPDFVTSFTKLMQNLVARQVAIQWLRVIPFEGALGCSTEDAAAMHMCAAAIARATHADVRAVGFNQVVSHMDRMVEKPLPGLFRDYMDGVANNTPRASFWRLDTAANQPESVNIMHYSNGVFEGGAILNTPVDRGVIAYTDFYRYIYRTVAVPVAG